MCYYGLQRTRDKMRISTIDICAEFQFEMAAELYEVSLEI